MTLSILCYFNVLLLLRSAAGLTGVNGNTMEGVVQNELLYENVPFIPKEYIPIHVPSERIAALTDDDMPEELQDENHGIKMGIPWRDCDDAKTDLFDDWDGNEADYICYGEKILPLMVTSTITIVQIELPLYMASHYCMFSPLEYPEPMPFYGSHRPLWPVYGEFEYLPAARWLHSLEHGAIAFFYHPCAREDFVQQIREILSGCLRKYIIAKHTYLEEEEPFLLMSWGSKYFMSGVNETDIIRYIRGYAMLAPESHNLGQGWYNWTLIKESSEPRQGSDIYESHICPQFPVNL